MVWQEQPWARMMPFSLASEEDVHAAAVTGGPVAFGNAVDEDDVDVIGASSRR